MRKLVNVVWLVAVLISVSFSSVFPQAGSEKSVGMSYDYLRTKKMALGAKYFDEQQYCWSYDCGPSKHIDQKASLVVEPNVGIGTIVPEAPLDVRNGSVSSGGTIALFGSTDRNATALGIGIAGNNMGLSQEKSGIFLHVLQLGVSDDRPLILQVPKGNVGIGTPEPTAKLEVAGDVKITGALFASPNIYQVEKNKQDTLSGASWTDYMTQEITVGKDDSNVLFIFSFSQPYEVNFPSVAWRVGLNDKYSNPKFIRSVAANWNVSPGGLTFLMHVPKAGVYKARLQHKFHSGHWEMSSVHQADAYNSLIIIVL